MEDDMLRWNGPWRRRCEALNQDGCVEAGGFSGVAVLRDSVLGDASPTLRFSGDSWDVLVDKIKRGTLDMTANT
jgi:hypothetical protein